MRSLKRISMPIKDRHRAPSEDGDDRASLEAIPLAHARGHLYASSSSPTRQRSTNKPHTTKQSNTWIRSNASCKSAPVTSTVLLVARALRWTTPRVSESERRAATTCEEHGGCAHGVCRGNQRICAFQQALLDRHPGHRENAPRIRGRGWEEPRSRTAT